MNANTTNDRNPLTALMAPVNSALQPKTSYTATPTTRNGDGFHRGDGKPTDGPAQYLLQPSGKLPPRAFEVHERERRRFHLMARAVPLNENAFNEVEKIGHAIFDATYGSEGVKFEHEITVGHLEVNRLTVEKRQLNDALEKIEGTEKKEEPEPRLPTWFSVKWWAFIACCVIVCLSSCAALALIASLYLPIVQSWLFASIAASPWILAAGAVEVFVLLTLKSEGAKRAAMGGAILVLMVGIALWLTGLYCLAAPLNTDLSSSTILVPDRRLAIGGQLLCELAVSFLFLTAMFQLIEYSKLILPSENRRRIEACVAEIDTKLGGTIRELGKAGGNLAEWTASRTAFIQEGITIIRLRVPDAMWSAEIQRRHAENQSLLEEFSANKQPTTNNQNENHHP